MVTHLDNFAADNVAWLQVRSRLVVTAVRCRSCCSRERSGRQCQTEAMTLGVHGRHHDTHSLHSNGRWSGQVSSCHTAVQAAASQSVELMRKQFLLGVPHMCRFAGSLWPRGAV